MRLSVVRIDALLNRNYVMKRDRKYRYNAEYLDIGICSQRVCSDTKGVSAQMPGGEQIDRHAK